MTDPLGNVTAYDYDERGRRTSITEPDPITGAATGPETVYAYDEAGQLETVTDARGHVTSYTYDNLGRTLTVTAPDPDEGLTPDVIFGQVFDNAGNRKDLTATIGTTKDFANSYEYDHQNRMTRVIQQAQSGGNAVAEKRVGFGYNALSQFDSLTRYADAAGTELVATTTFGYDGANRLSSTQHAHGMTELAGYDYVYDLANRITSIDSLIDGLSEFNYDDTNQLTGADHDVSSQVDESYEYDENGNRIMAGHNVDPNNQLASDGTYNYTYDAEGNRISKTTIATDDREEYTWDYRNRLTQVTFLDDEDNVVKTVSYIYDAYNRLVGVELDSNGESSGGVSNRYFIYDGLQMTLEFDGSAATEVLHRYLWGPDVDQILADEQVTTVASTGLVVWPLTDHLGTARDLALHNSTTHVTQIDNHRVYDSFGNLTDQTLAAVMTDIQWTGRWSDSQTGLQWNLNRWYSSNSGQWLSEDPIEFKGGDSNLRSAVGNFVTGSVDPLGLWTVGANVGFSFGMILSINVTLDFNVGYDPNSGEISASWGPTYGVNIGPHATVSAGVGGLVTTAPNAQSLAGHAQNYGVMAGPYGTGALVLSDGATWTGQADSNNWSGIAYSNGPGVSVGAVKEFSWSDYWAYSSKTGWVDTPNFREGHGPGNPGCGQDLILEQ